MAAAEFLAREAGRESLVTVTKTDLSDDGRRGVVYITVLPAGQSPSRAALEAAEASALAFAQRHRGELAEPFREHIKGAALPYIEYRIDRGEKNRKRLDELPG